MLNGALLLIHALEQGKQMHGTFFLSTVFSFKSKGHFLSTALDITLLQL